MSKANDLAKIIDPGFSHWSPEEQIQAASELRRLNTVNADLLQALKSSLAAMLEASGANMSAARIVCADINLAREAITKAES
jgi:hypothetical protein